MKLFILQFLFIFFLGFNLLFANKTITSNQIGISIQVPDQWRDFLRADTHIVFKDTTQSYRSQITIKKHLRNSADYSQPADWTKSHFIAYLLVVKNSADPAGAVLYFDSTANNRIDSIWSPEAFSQFYSTDTSIGSWNEYLRFAAIGNYGFEIYALGDTVDMKKNIDFYTSIIGSIRFSRESLKNSSRYRHLTIYQANRSNDNQSPKMYNLLGMSCNGQNANVGRIVVTNKNIFRSNNLRGTQKAYNTIIILSQ